MTDIQLTACSNCGEILECKNCGAPVHCQNRRNLAKLDALLKAAKRLVAFTDVPERQAIQIAGSAVPILIHPLRDAIAEYEGATDGR